MRVLVAGPYPPSPSPEAGATLDQVRRLLGEGHEVEVVSPEPGAAQRFAPLTGPSGAWWILRHRLGFDALVVVIGATMPLRPGVGRLGRLLDCSTLGLAMRVWPLVTFDGRGLRGVPGSIGGRSGQLLWRRADHVVVGSDADQAWLHDIGAVDLEVISVIGATDRAGETPSRPWPLPSDVTRQEVMAQVRARSVIQRAEPSAMQLPPAPPPPTWPGRVARRAFRLVFRGQADRVSRRLRRVGRASSVRGQTRAWTTAR